jgi:hypothetical protein
MISLFMADIFDCGALSSPIYLVGEPFHHRMPQTRYIRTTELTDIRTAE